MDIFPKFIIEGENLIIAKVSYHKDIVTDKSKVKGGGWFTGPDENKKIVFYGSSEDFGAAKFEDIKECFVNKNIFSRPLRNITHLYEFYYNTGAEIIKL